MKYKWDALKALGMCLPYRQPQGSSCDLQTASRQWILVKRKAQGFCFFMCMFSVPATLLFHSFCKPSVYWVYSWFSTMFHLPDCTQFSSFYVVQFKLGNLQGLYFSSTLPSSYNYLFLLTGVFIWQQKLNFKQPKGRRSPHLLK